MKTGKEFVERYTSMFTEDKEWWANTLDEWFKPYDVTYKDERIDLQNELIKERDQEIQYQKSLITQLQSTIDEKNNEIAELQKKYNNCDADLFDATSEIERLKGLIKSSFVYGFNCLDEKTENEYWQQFEIENNLQLKTS